MLGTESGPVGEKNDRLDTNRTRTVNFSFYFSNAPNNKLELMSAHGITFGPEWARSIHSPDIRDFPLG